MPSSLSFAVRLPLFLLGTMATVGVFLPIGCGATGGGSAALDSAGVIAKLTANSSINIFPDLEVLLHKPNKEDIELAYKIHTKYANRIPEKLMKGLDRDGPVKMAILVMMSMPSGKRAANIDGLLDLAIALAIRQMYIKLLPHYRFIKREEKKHPEGKNGLAHYLFAVLKLGDRGTRSPKALARRQILIAQSGHHVLNMAPDVLSPTLSVHKKAEILRELINLVEFLNTAMEILNKENGGQHNLEGTSVVRNVDWGKVAMEVMEVMDLLEAKMAGTPADHAVPAQDNPTENSDLEKDIQTYYDQYMRIRIRGDDMVENVKTVIQVMMSMPSGNKARNEILKLAIALDIREQYKELLSFYDGIKESEEKHGGGPERLIEEKNYLADGLVRVLKLCGDGTSHPETLARRQANIAISGRNVLMERPPVGEDVLSNGKHPALSMQKKEEVLQELTHFVDFFKETVGIIYDIAEPMNKGDTVVRNLHRGESAMEVMRVFEAKITKEAGSSHAHHVEQGGDGGDPHPHDHVHRKNAPNHGADDNGKNAAGTEGNHHKGNTAAGRKGRRVQFTLP